jgi:hypothetical protein
MTAVSHPFNAFALVEIASEFFVPGGSLRVGNAICN